MLNIQTEFEIEYYHSTKLGAGQHSPTINKVVTRFKEDQAKRRPVHGAATYTYMIDKQKKKEEAMRRRREANLKRPLGNPLGDTVVKGAVFKKPSDCNLVEIP